MDYFTKKNYKLFKRCPRLFAYDYFKIVSDFKEPSHRGHLISEQGKNIGLLVHDLYKQSCAVLIPPSASPLAIEKTKKALLEYDIIFEATFGFENLLMKADIFNVLENELIEIKSTLEIKEEHYHDLLFQLYVIKNSHLCPEKITLGILNRDNIFQAKINLAELFKFQDLTAEIYSLLPEFECEISEMRIIAESKQLPALLIGPHCESEVTCPYQRQCWGEISNHSIFNLRQGGVKRFELHQAGIHHLKDIPLYLKLSSYQSLQRESEIKNCPIINQRELQETLGEISFPLYFLNLETIMTAIPQYPNMVPYQQIPFLVSILKMATPDKKSHHNIYLSTEAKDSRLELLLFLLESLGINGSIVCYHATFVIGRLYELIKIAPDKENQILSIIERIWDLEKVFREGSYVDYRFEGSTSFNIVQPVFTPQVWFSDLKIQNEAMAFAAYFKLLSQKNFLEKQEIQHSLEEYCKRKTFSMSMILKKLLREVSV